MRDMFRALATAVVLGLSAASGAAADQTVDIKAVTADGIGKSLGTVTISESADGLSMKISLSGLTDGDHGFHVHEKGDCGPSMKDGKMVAANAAGPHFDPGGTKSHKGPGAAGHAGDLPKLTAKDGKVEQTAAVSGLKAADIAGRSLMIHEAGDNYTDQPENGGGKGRIACGVIPK
jgi:Cu-Zn family superoxide dismutase